VAKRLLMRWMKRPHLSGVLKIELTTKSRGATLSF